MLLRRFGWVAALSAAAVGLTWMSGAGQPPKPAEQPAAVQPAQPAAATMRFGWDAPIAKPAGALRIAAYNVENLFDDKDDPALSGADEDKDATKPEAERKGLSEAIHRANPDVLAMEEVESKETVIWFRDQFLADMGYQYVASIDVGAERGIENAVLSKYPLSDEKVWKEMALGGNHPDKYGDSPNPYAGKPLLFRRSPLRVTVTVPKDLATDGKDAQTYSVTLFVVHHKSGDARNNYWREKETAKVVELVHEFEVAHAPPAGGGGANVLVVGDFNGTAEAKSVKTYTESGLFDCFGDRVRGDKRFVTHESGRSIDYVLMNAGARKEFVPETRFVLGCPARPAGVDWRSTPPPPGYGSDHYPVVVDLVAHDVNGAE